MLPWLMCFIINTIINGPTNDYFNKIYKMLSVLLCEVDTR